MQEDEPGRLARQVVDRCADCELCRDLMEDAPCLFFPQLFRLHDREKAENRKITSAELRGLLDLCNMCGLCSCPDVRTDIMRAKDAFIARDGLSPAIRLLEDVERVARICGSAPRLANLLLGKEPSASLLKRLLGVHRERVVPEFPREGFAAWARRRGLHEKHPVSGRKVAYFAGCTARVLFPDVAKAAVEVLERNGVSVYVPEQKCCGMPSLLEGDRPFTFKVAEFNLRHLDAAVQDGYDIVCSCPTCGYMLKKVLCEGAFYSEEYRASFKKMMEEARGDTGKAAEWMVRDGAGSNGGATPPSPRCGPPQGFTQYFSAHLQDEGYFRSLNGLKRIAIASHTYDLGEYLSDMDQAGELDRNMGAVPGRMAYYAPCHLKEQNIGQPWFDLIGLVPGASIEKVGAPFDCCGMAGVMGFKREFHEVSIAMGSRLMEKIKEKNPDKLVSDCLSCRIQFNQVLPYSVYHPVEILSAAYGAAAPLPQRERPSSAAARRSLPSPR